MNIRHIFHLNFFFPLESCIFLLIFIVAICNDFRSYFVTEIRQIYPHFIRNCSLYMAVFNSRDS